MLNTIIDGCPWCGVPKQHVPSNPNSLMQPALSSDLDSALQNILIEDFYKYSINPFCVLFFVFIQLHFKVKSRLKETFSKLYNYTNQWCAL